MLLMLPEESKRLTGIYKISNTVNQKVYVGSAFCLVRRYDMHKSRLARGIHHSRGLQASVNKYGLENFRFELIELCDKKDVIPKEQYWIDRYNSYKKGYNSSPTAGNRAGMKLSEREIAMIIKRNTGRPCSPETRRKIGESQKGKIISVEQRKKMSKTLKGRKLSPESKAKQSASLKKYAQTPEAKAHYVKIGGMNKGRKMKEEFRIAMSKRQKGKPGRPLSEESKLKISEKNKGRPKTPEQIELARQLCLDRVKNGIYLSPPKPVNQLDMEGNFVKYYDSMTNTRKDGFEATNILKVIKGERKHHKGFKWEYAAKQ